ncbi:hypothetical protein RAH41_13935 [Gottfriedia acidiceleris]
MKTNFTFSTTLVHKQNLLQITKKVVKVYVCGTTVSRYPKHSAQSIP